MADVGSARVQVTGDVSRFARQVQDDLNRALRGIRLEGLERQFDDIGRSARENADDVGDAFQRSGEQVEDALDEIGRSAGENASDVERAFERSGEEAEDALEEVGDRGEKEFDRIEREAKDAGSGMSRALKGAAIGIAAAFAAVQIGQFLKDSVLEAESLGSAIAATEQIIESTEGAAGLLADEIRDLSKELSLRIGVDSVEVQNAANVLLTFKNVSEDTFGSALELAADLSSVLGTDLQGATLQLGKALNDPVAGITALARAGVQFTDSQKEQIKALVESNDLLGAQEIILGELESQVGGVAEANADSTAKMRNAFLELQRAIGGPLIEAIDQLTPALLDVVEGVGPALGAIGGTLAEALLGLAPALAVLGDALADALGRIDLSLVGEALGAVIEALSPLLPVIGQLVGTLLPPLAQIVGALAGPLGVIAEIIGDALTQALEALEPHLPVIVDLFRQMAVAMAENLEQTLPIIADLFSELLVAFLPLIPSLVELTAALLPLLTNVDANVIILQALSDILLLTVVPAVEALNALLTGDFANAFPQVTFQVDLMRDIIESAFRFVTRFVGDSVGRLRSILNGVGSIVSNVLGFFSNLRSGAIDRFNSLVGFVRDIPGRIKAALGNLSNLLRDAGRQVIQGFLDAIRGKFDEVRDTFANLTNLIPDWKGPRERDRALLREAGRNVMQGFQSGINDETDNLRRQLQRITAEMQPSATVSADMVAGGDGSAATPFFDSAGRAIRIDNLNMTVTDRVLPMSEVFRNLEMIGGS